MSTLTEIEKRYFERIFNMAGGYVLDFTDATYDEFFKRHRFNIHGTRYQTYGTSKAKKMRAFWEQEPDVVVAPILSEMLETYVAIRDLSEQDVDTRLLEKSQAIIARLLGKSTIVQADSLEDFLHSEFEIPNIEKLPVEYSVVGIIEGRLNEARTALSAGAHLSVIFLCGSILEGVLLGAAQKEAEKFNRSSSSPKRPNGKVKPFHEWSLAQFIDVACDVNLLNLDVKKFSHGLRDFRNYIHPYEQMVSGFTPDEHTAKVCFQILKAALADIAGERK